MKPCLYPFEGGKRWEGWSLEVPKSMKKEEKNPAVKSLVSKVKFEVYGEEMIDKQVKQSGASGRVYLPPDWVNRHVKIIRVD